MDIQLIDENLINVLTEKAQHSERLRQNFDLRTTPNDGSQRMLNVLEPGTKVPIHRHLKTSESVICLEGCLDWVFFAEQSGRAERYEELPDMDADGPAHDSETAADETCFKEIARFRVCPREKVYGIQVPLGAWHSIEVHEPSTIFEAKDGAYTPR